MKAFWIKTVNIIVIAVLIFMYQTGAVSYEKMSKVVDDLKAQLEERQKQDTAAAYKDGTYEGEGSGYSGKLKVKVTVSGGRISEIEITETKDDQAYLELASQLTDVIIEKQSTEEVDTVSGATFSSRGILEAVSNALEGAGN